MEEKTYYSDNSISVTSTRVIVGSTTYSLRNVSSVKMTSIVPSHVIDIILILIGVITLIIGLAALKETSGICLIVGILIGVAGFFIFKSKKTTYYVVLGTNSGEQKAIYSIDLEYINKIVSEINNAIMDYK
jgi:hypothetical protein